jgi:hypothetical protein
MRRQANKLHPGDYVCCFGSCQRTGVSGVNSDTDGENATAQEIVHAARQQQAMVFESQRNETDVSTGFSDPSPTRLGFSF